MTFSIRACSRTRSPRISATAFWAFCSSWISCSRRRLYACSCGVSGCCCADIGAATARSRAPAIRLRFIAYGLGTGGPAPRLAPQRVRRRRSRRRRGCWRQRLLDALQLLLETLQALALAAQLRLDLQTALFEVQQSLRL